MASVTFRGDQAVPNGTSLDLLNGVNLSYGYAVNDDRLDAVSYRHGTGSAQRIVYFELDPVSRSTSFVSGISGYGHPGGTSTNLLTIDGLQDQVRLDPTLGPTQQHNVLLPQLAQLVRNMLRGNDVINLSSYVSSFYGDYKTVAAADADQMGNDYIRMRGLFLPTGSTSIAIFGDAQVVLTGATARGGNDVITTALTGAPLTIFGDFQFVEGTATFGNDRVYGGNDADTIYGDSQSSGAAGGNDLLVGNQGNDQLYGGGGNDVLDGRYGGDRLDGGAGTDIAAYEWSGSGLTADLLTPGTNTLEAIGDVYVGVEGLTGSRFADVLGGNNLPNFLSGGIGSDILNGRGGNDWLNGGAGADQMAGGLGDDRIYVDNAGDKVFEAAKQGTDTVLTSVSYTLAAGQHIETLATIAVAGTGAIHLVGNQLGQRIIGNNGGNALYGLAGNDVLVGYGGNDWLRGGAGNDSLAGGAGFDSFFFDTVPNPASNVDRITDFSVPQDTIRLDNAVMAGLGATLGTLSAAKFWKSNAGVAHDANDRIIYDIDSGRLFYDANGGAAGGSVHFATLAPNLALTNWDFVVI